MNVLRIDTTSAGQTEIQFLQGVKVVQTLIRERANGTAAQVVLPMIDEMLLACNVDLADIDAIEVVEGPGSFTGTRVGVAIANALGLALQITVNGQPVGGFVRPIYSEPPKITAQKLEHS